MERCKKMMVTDRLFVKQDNVQLCETRMVRVWVEMAWLGNISSFEIKNTLNILQSQMHWQKVDIASCQTGGEQFSNYSNPQISGL